MNDLRFYKLREVFPNYMEVGKVYPWPQVPTQLEWEEFSKPGDMMPSWRAQTGSGLYIMFSADWPKQEDKVDDRGRWGVELRARNGEFVCHVMVTDSLEAIGSEMRYLAGILEDSNHG